jgi:hypothetical protein
MLQPELQDPEVFVEGIDNIVTTQKRVAEMYFEDGSVNQACPPLKALLHFMARGEWEGKNLSDPAMRHLFTREYLLSSVWYAARLSARQELDCRLWNRHVEYLTKFLKRTSHADEAERLGIAERLQHARQRLKEVGSPEHLQKLAGTLGTEPIQNYVSPR